MKNTTTELEAPRPELPSTSLRSQLWLSRATRKTNALGFLTGLIWGSLFGTWSTLQAAVNQVQPSVSGILIMLVPLAFIVASLFTRKGTLPRQFIGWAGAGASIGWLTSFFIVAGRLIAAQT